MNRIKRKAMCLLTGLSLFTIGSCTLDSWNVALGPVFNGHGERRVHAAWVGVELEFSNGVDFIVPLVGIGEDVRRPGF